MDVRRLVDCRKIPDCYRPLMVIDSFDPNVNVRVIAKCEERAFAARVSCLKRRLSQLLIIPLSLCLILFLITARLTCAKIPCQRTWQLSATVRGKRLLGTCRVLRASRSCVPTPRVLCPM